MMVCLDGDNLKCKAEEGDPKLNHESEFLSQLLPFSSSFLCFFCEIITTSDLFFPSISTS